MSDPVGPLTSIVIRLVDHGERNRIVTLLTAEAGKVSAIARGARGKSRRFGGHLDLFHMGEAECTRRNRAGLATLQRFDVKEPFVGLRQDIIRFAVASFLVELIALTTVEDAEDHRQFALVHRMLSSLVDEPETSARHTLLGFQLQWFYALGMLPELTPAGMVSAHIRPLADASLHAAAALLTGQPLPEPLNTEALHDIGRLTRSLRYRVLSRPLASEAFLRQALRDL